MFLLSLAWSQATLTPARAQDTETILHTFNAYADGAYPVARLIQGQDGAYYGTTNLGGTNKEGTVYKWDASGLTSLHSFTGPEGAYPQASLIQASDGSFYGVTVQGGRYGNGVVFKMQPDGTLTVLHSFSATDANGANQDGAYPIAGVILARNGHLYGVTSAGGTGGKGTIFQLNIWGTVSRTLHSFDGNDGSSPKGSLIQARDGRLYGVTASGGSGSCGTVFRINTNGDSFLTLHSFQGGADAGPLAGLLQASDGALYGTTYQGGAYQKGAVFRLRADGSGFQILHSFNGADGASVVAGVIQASDGYLYGTTNLGGANTQGAIYKLSTDGSLFNTIHDFDPTTGGHSPSAGVIQGSDGLLHGATGQLIHHELLDNGTLYTVDTAGQSFQTNYNFNGGFVDGEIPSIDRLALGPDGCYYGATQQGGLYGRGILYKISPTGVLTVLHHFDLSDTRYPYRRITFDNQGNLYGTTGGEFYQGAIYRYTLSTQTFTILYQFHQSRRYAMLGSLLYHNGSLYGVDGLGGRDEYGSVYQLTLATATRPQAFRILHEFSGWPDDGDTPGGALLWGPDGNLYGTTPFGGTADEGTVYRLTPAGKITILHSFCGDGSMPWDGLLLGRDGMLYGTTRTGGPGFYGYDDGYGTVFQISMDGSAFNMLYSFRGYPADGAYPLRLLQGSDGLLYITTQEGGANNNGAVFSIRPDGSLPTMLYAFGPAGEDGIQPHTGVLEGPDGNLYGTTSQGGINPGFNTDIQGTVYCLQTRLPILKNFWPGAGSVSAGTAITIQGMNLAGASIVTIGSVSQAIVSQTNTLIKIKLTAGTPAGSYPIQVTTPNGTATSAKQITIQP